MKRQTHRHQGTGGRRGPRSFQPQLEVLPDRIAPATIPVLGTAGPDTVIIDEPAGTVTVNGVVTAMITDPSNLYLVLTFGGADGVAVIDGIGDDNYYIETGLHSDVVYVLDGPGSDNYGIITDELLDPIGGDDVVYVVDGPNATAVQHYTIRTGSGNDTVIIFDFPAASAVDKDDIYDVNTAHGDDLVIVVDTAGRDLYALEGGPQFDTLFIGDVAGDLPPFQDVVGINGFESVMGVFV